MKKKVALMTCFLDNFGACLQALALQSEIEKLGCHCRIIAYTEPSGYNNDEFVQTFIEKISREIFGIVNIFIKGKSFKKYIKRKLFKKNKRNYAFKKFRNKYLNFECANDSKKVNVYCRYEELALLSEKYDAFVCGSDQIWNPTFYNRNHPAYFLRFAGDKKRIAYAPSIGLSELPNQYIDTFVTYVKDFDYVSVREKRGSEIIKELCDIDAKVVLDPTLLIGRNYWQSLLEPQYKTPFRKYIFCYIFSNTKAVSDYLKMVQENTGLPIVYVNVSNLSYESLIACCKKNAGPIDFLQLIKNAEFILTDSFHGTAFSLLFNKDFYVFERKRTDETIDMFSRIKSVLSYAGLEDRIVSINESFIKKEVIDYAPVNEIFEVLCKDSEAFLNEALYGEKNEDN